jgi:cell wall-associated NlpC family hydrolase
VPPHLSLSRALVPAAGRLTLLLALVLAMLASLLVTTAPEASAATPVAQRALAEAPKHQGKAYRWGATGPSRFDCSGFTGYVFARAGKTLPRTSRQQYAAAQKIAKHQKRPGDLIFLRNNRGQIYHVGLYAGGTDMWAATRTGDVVRKQRIWSPNYVVGRYA